MNTICLCPKCNSTITFDNIRECNTNEKETIFEMECGECGYIFYIKGELEYTLQNVKYIEE